MITVAKRIDNPGEQIRHRVIARGEDITSEQIRALASNGEVFVYLGEHITVINGNVSPSQEWVFDLVV